MASASLGEAGGQILGVPAHQPDAIAVLVGEHAVAVDLFLVDWWKGCATKVGCIGVMAEGIRSSVARRGTDGG
jgi:hypothetical protein